MPLEQALFPPKSDFMRPGRHGTKIAYMVCGSIEMKLDGVRILILSGLFLVIGQVSVQAAQVPSFEPKGISIVNVSESVNASLEKHESMIPAQLDRAGAAKEADSKPKRVISMDPETVEWAQMIKVNASAVFIQLKF